MWDLAGFLIAGIICYLLLGSDSPPVEGDEETKGYIAARELIEELKNNNNQ